LAEKREISQRRTAHVDESDIKMDAEAVTWEYELDSSGSR
jgi:hypothetical protein